MSHVSLSVRLPDLPSGTPLAAELVDTGRRTVQQMPMPVGETTRVQVEPGNYLVQVTLPSGEMLDGHVSVGANEAKALELRPGSAPAASPASRPGRPGKASFAGSPARPRRVVGLPPDILPTIPAERRPARRRQQPTLAGIWMRVWAKAGKDQDWKPIAWPGRSISHRHSEARCSFQLQRRRIHMLQVGGANVPWRLISLPPTPEPIDVVLRASGTPAGRRPSSDFDAGVTITVSSRDGIAEVMLGYLTVGRLDAAETVGEPLLRDAEALLFAKLENPMGAAIGGYYLLRMRAEAQLHNWPRNFAEWAPWLPDAAVIHATQLLHQRSVPREQVRQRLLQAVHAGVPVYTEGLRLLYDIVQLFADDARAREAEDKEVSSAVEWIRPYATAADWQQPLTSFWGASPAEPSLAPATGRPRGRALGIRTVQAR